MTATADGRRATLRAGAAGRVRGDASVPARWAPLAVTVLFVAGLLLRAGTAPVDLVRYGGYAILAVVLPGTLLYRALRRRPHTLVEDLAMGAAVGLALEIAAWAAFSLLDLRGLVWLWPALVLAPFAAIPRLRRHWWVRDYTRVPVGWSWSVASVVCFFTAYLAVAFLDRNPILPTSDDTRQYLDLPYQLSLAGEAKHHFPVMLPQVAGEPLYYHWFGHVHMAMTSMVGHIDLPVVALRLAIPALSALAIVLTAVVGWRVTGKPYAGAVAAVLFFAIGEFNFTHPVTMPFGSQATFVVWHGMSMIYSWVLLLAVIAPLADVVRHDTGAPDPAAEESAKGRFRVAGAPAIGRGALAVAALLLVASSGAKASSVPVVAIALAVAAVALVIARRRVPWGVVAAGLIAGGAQLFATAVLYRFQTYGVGFGPLQGLARYWADAGAWRWLIVAAVCAAFGLNMLLRTAGVAPMLWLRRGRLDPVQLFLLGGAAAGPGLYLVLSQPSAGNQYFTRAGFAFGVLLSAWGYLLVYERARLPGPAARLLAAAAGAFALVLVAVQLWFARPAPSGRSYAPLLPILGWAGALGLIGFAGVVAWRFMRRRAPQLRGRGVLVALTFLLVAGAPGLIMDGYKSIQVPNGGSQDTVPLPKSRVDAARFVRDNSEPDDVIATNVHCVAAVDGGCDSRSFWLSAYAERSVLVEGWAFAPRMATHELGAPFWDPAKLARNDAAFTSPTAAGLRELRDRDGVRWLVVDRTVSPESPLLRTLATLRYDDGRMAVYELH